MLAIILMIFCVTLSGGGGGGVAFVQCDNATADTLTLLPSLSPSLVSSHPTLPPPPSPPIDLVTSAKQMARTHSTNITAAKLETASAKLKHM